MPDSNPITEAKSWTWKELTNYGLAFVVLAIATYVTWNTNITLTSYIQTQLVEDRDKMSMDAKAHATIIAQNSEQLKQNSEVLATVLDNNHVTMEVVNKALDTIEDHAK
jgi:hypothetical protein